MMVIQSSNQNVEHTEKQIRMTNKQTANMNYGKKREMRMMNKQQIRMMNKQTAKENDENTNSKI